MTPSVGRIVHYVWPDAEKGFVCRAGIITDVFTQDPMKISVAVLFPHGSAFYEGVEYDDGRISKAYTWHWPERV